MNDDLTFHSPLKALALTRLLRIREIGRVYVYRVTGLEFELTGEPEPPAAEPPGLPAPPPIPPPTYAAASCGTT